MKLKWRDYIVCVFQTIGLIYKCGGIKKAAVYVDKEHARLKKEFELRSEDLKSQIEAMVESAITRRLEVIEFMLRK